MTIKIVEVDDIVISSDIAHRFGVVQSAVINWSKRYDDFPEPFTHVGQENGRRGFALYRWSDVLRWHAARAEVVGGLTIERMREIVAAYDERMEEDRDDAAAS